MSTFEFLRKQYSHETSIHQDKMVTGTVYTPNIVAKKMVYLLLKNHVENSGCPKSFGINAFETIYLENYLLDKPAELSIAQNLYDYFSKLTLLDLSCGSGALLLAYLEFIDYLFMASMELKKNTLKCVLENKIFGVDVESKAISSLRETLNAYSEQKGLGTLELKLYCLDSLIDDLPFDHQSFDLIIGNPPYIGEKNNLSWFKPVKLTDFGKTYYEGKMDFFYFFIYKGYDYIKPNGSLCYLSSNYFFTADGAKKLRNFIKNKFNMVKFLDFAEERIFPDKKLHACAYVLQKSPTHTSTKYNTQLVAEKQFIYDDIYHVDDTMSFIVSDETRKILLSMTHEQLGNIGTYYDINQGIVSGADEQFVYLNSAIQNLPASLHQYLKPFYKNSDIDHYKIKKCNDRQILYIDRAEVCDELLEWLLPYKEKLSKRREVIKGIREWYMLTWPRSEHIFKGEKIVVPQRALTNRFAFVNFPFYASADVYFITATPNSPYSLETLTQILNSDLYQLWLNHKGKKKGNLLELYATPLKNLPLPKLTEEECHKISQGHIDFDINLVLKKSFNIQ